MEDIADSTKSKKKIIRLIIPVILAIIVIGAITFIFKNGFTPSGLISNKDANKDIEIMEDDLYTPDENAIKIDEKTGINYVNNMVIIFFEPETPETEIDSTIESIDGEIVGRLEFIDQYQVRVKEQTLDDLIKLCEDLEELDCVSSAIFDQLFLTDTNAVPDDPWTGNIFNPHKWDQSNPKGSNWWLEAIDAMDAWDNDNKFGHINIGIVDSGFDYNHEDLKNVIKSVSANNSKDGHGTHVAGIIGAEANNKKGITGLVWNCDIYTSDWLLTDFQDWVNKKEDLGWNTTTQILGGTLQLIQKGAQIVNLSAGAGGLEGTSWSEDVIDAAGRNASSYLYALLIRDIDFLIVQSAGNGNKNHVSVDARNNLYFSAIAGDNCITGPNVKASDYLDRIIIVGAAKKDSNGNYIQRSSSNAGDRVDICAPGENIYSTVPGGLHGKYDYHDGTSMASPVVTGVSALVWSANPFLTGPEVKQIVCDENNTRYAVGDNTSEKHPLNDTYRMVNANLAVRAALERLSSDEEEPELETEADVSAESEQEETEKQQANESNLSIEDIQGFWIADDPEHEMSYSMEFFEDGSCEYNVILYPLIDGKYMEATGTGLFYEGSYEFKNSTPNMINLVMDLEDPYAEEGNIRYINDTFSFKIKDDGVFEATLENGDILPVTAIPLTFYRGGKDPDTGRYMIGADLTTDESSYVSVIEKYKRAIKNTEGSDFSLSLDATVDIFATDGSQQESAKEYIYMYTDIVKNNTDDMRMSGSCSVSVEDTSTAYSFYYEDGKAYCEYTQPYYQKGIAETSPIKNVAAYNFDLNKNDVIWAAEQDKTIQLEFYGDVLNLDALLEETLGSSYGCKCDSVLLTMETDNSGRPSDITLQYTITLEMDGASGTLDYYEVLTFSNYGDVSVTRPSDLDSYDV